jgi:hypothetical protein
MNQKLSEYHTSYRIFSAVILRQIPLERHSGDFVSGNKIIAQCCFSFPIFKRQ